MIERPILFNGAMVRALLDGRKTQTRRAVKMPPSWDCFVCADWGDGWWPYRSDDGESPTYDNNEIRLNCPYGQPGDRLWVRETFGEVYDWCDHPEMPGAPTERWHIDWKYRADGEPDRPHLEGAWTGWKPSIHMPRAASRILLEVVSVHVERLQDISQEDAAAEGITDPGCTNCGEPEAKCACSFPMPDYRDAYAYLWGQINGPDSWLANPWVWVVEFKRVAP
ncbi:hypothetical protein [Massilia sp. NP310]|uniref:hypothetical protein n=1 Tax=Massilia sp. NP310 TaxID=2861282 RepID=UPI001C62E411|nr:hypothetical protein [Massilia sp. NP310]QYG03854.1 hypothetical protein KY496_10975 [Massilia sp. NP310]